MMLGPALQGLWPALQGPWPAPAPARAPLPALRPLPSPVVLYVRRWRPRLLIPRPQHQRLLLDPRPSPPAPAAASALGTVRWRQRAQECTPRGSALTSASGSPAGPPPSKRSAVPPSVPPVPSRCAPSHAAWAVSGSALSPSSASSASTVGLAGALPAPFFFLPPIAARSPEPLRTSTHRTGLFPATFPLHACPLCYHPATSFYMKRVLIIIFLFCGLVGFN